MSRKKRRTARECSTYAAANPTIPTDSLKAIVPSDSFVSANKQSSALSSTEMEQPKLMHFEEIHPTSHPLHVEVNELPKAHHNVSNIMHESTTSLEIKRRSSCHRCGNMRRNPMHCVNRNCPQIFCRKCSTRLIEIYGTAIFQKGCPVCMQVCCCSNKSRACNRPFHCYRKCPASKLLIHEKPMVMDMPTFIQSLTPSLPKPVEPIPQIQETVRNETVSAPAVEMLLSPDQERDEIKNKPPAKKRKVAESTHQRASDILLSMQHYENSQPDHDVGNNDQTNAVIKNTEAALSDSWKISSRSDSATAKSPKSGHSSSAPNGPESLSLLTDTLFFPQTRTKPSRAIPLNEMS